ncbi:MAG: MerR family transcriptional regulator [Actinomycetaceae bacterium]|nr:MerR family transcriptional regulator [Actinomycetaceae bacterium]
MAETPETMSIGEFSSLSRISVRMLRHYDAHGVLVPADIDPVTGYRRYSPSQLRDAVDIRKLRDVRFGVSAISALLAVRGTPAWTSALHLQRTVLAGELSAAKARLALIDQLLCEGDPAMSIEIERITIPAMRVVALRGTVPAYKDEGRLWEEMVPLIRQQGIEPIGPAGTIEHDEEYKESDVDLSIFLPVADGVNATAPLEILELPERECLVAHVSGSYDQITRANEMIAERLVRDGLCRPSDGALASKVFNFYFNEPSEVAEEDLRTDVHWPVCC